jgi:undecaprenyl-diphosphatase
MTHWHALILGIVEGITEYLPVSSTGHLIITSNLLGLTSEKNKSAIDAFEIVIQGGAILAVVGLYWPRFMQMLRGLMGRDNAGFQLFVNICIAFLPAAVIGVVIKKWINAHLFYAAPVVLAFVVGGIYMIIVEACRSGRWGRAARLPYHGAGKGIDEVTPLDALKIGFLQVLSMWPGTSRSMMTITGGYFCKLRPAAAAEFSFLLGVPTLLGATVLALWDDWKDHKANGSPMFYTELGGTSVVIGLVVAAVSAALAVKWLVGFLNRRGLAPFGVYRILLGVALVGLILGGLVTIKPETKPASGAAAPAAPAAPLPMTR